MAGTTGLEPAASARGRLRDLFYNNLRGTAKLSVSHERLHEWWAGLSVGKSCRWP